MKEKMKRRYKCMSYYIAEPEVAGEIGENTVYSNYDAIVNNNESPQISHLHFVFDGWLGDELLEVTPCFLVSEKLKNEIIKNDLSGCEFHEIEISFSNEFLELYPNREMPKFFRIIPLKMIYVEESSFTIQDMSDFMISQKNYLIISEKAKKIITSYCSVNYASFDLLSVK